MGVEIKTTTTMATAVIRATVTKIMAKTTTTKLATTLGKKIRQTTAGRMDCVLTREQPAELLLTATKPPKLGPTAWAAVGATSDLLD